MKVEFVGNSNIPGIDPETSLVYMARVSSGKSDEDKYKDPEKLIKYLIKHKHWSPFEMVHAEFYIECGIDISRQLLRHKSFSFQEFSFRYNNSKLDIDFVEPIELRIKSKTNRQSSVEALEDEKLIELVKDFLLQSLSLYNHLLDNDVASECARRILPMCTKTSLYMCGSLRSWIHFLEVRCKEDTQKEHRVLAERLKEELKKIFPITFRCIDNV